MTGEQTRIVVADASVVINLAHSGLLTLMRDLPAHEFCVPEEVLVELIQPDQASAVQEAMALGWLSLEPLAELAEFRRFADLLAVLDPGEAACLALAESRGWLVACDERRVFLMCATECLGPGRVVNTWGLMVLAIRAQVLSVEDADRAKAILETHRFRMKCKSFEEMVQTKERR